MHVGTRIKRARDARGLTQEDLAGLVRQATRGRTALSTVQRWERTGSLKANELAVIARVLEVSADALLGLSDEEDPTPARHDDSRGDGDEGAALRGDPEVLSEALEQHQQSRRTSRRKPG